MEKHANPSGRAIAYFWDRVDALDRLNPNGCWNWIGTNDGHGYGYVTYEKKSMKAHRFSWMLHYNEHPRESWVLHKCDNPACVNPKHLFLGDRKANVADMVQKNRQPNYKKNFCPKGHKYTPENTVITTHGSRACLQCRKSYKRKNPEEYNRKRRESYASSPEQQQRYRQNAKKWREKNPERYKQQMRECYKRRKERPWNEKERSTPGGKPRRPQW